MFDSTSRQPASGHPSICPERILIHRGGVFNARIYRIHRPGNPAVVEKDFSEAPWAVRNTVGRFLIWREVRYLRRLSDVGIVPGHVARLSPFCLQEDFCGSKTLRTLLQHAPDSASRSGILSVDYFRRLYEGVLEVHRHRVVHLDLHNLRNILVLPGERPILIDWQSAVSTRLLPRPLRRLLEEIDMNGLLKALNKFHPEEMTDAWMKRLHHASIVRRLFWLPRIHVVPKPRK